MNTFWVHKNWKWKKENATAKYIDAQCEEAVTLADAQATIAALQARVRELEAEGVKLFEWRLALHSLTPGGSEFCTPNACEEWVRKHRASQHEYLIEQIVQRKDLQSQLTQRTAECDALKLVNDTHMKTVMKLSHVVEQRTAELERVRLLSSHNERRFELLEEKYKELRTLVLTLPKVEGEIVAQAGYVKDRKKVYACFGSGADMTAYAALLKHRQGMEG